MSCVRYVAALAVLVPVLALVWVLGCVIEVLDRLGRAVTRWSTGSDRLEGAE